MIPGVQVILNLGAETMVTISPMEKNETSERLLHSGEGCSVRLLFKKGGEKKE